MPRKPAPPALIRGPYAAPPCEPGSSLVDRLRGPLTVGGLTDAPIPWPYTSERAVRGGHSLILCGDLVRAVRTESAAAVAHHWGVGRGKVGDWRRALGVGRMTAGTAALWRELATRRLDRAACVRGGKARQAQKKAAGE